MKIRVRYTKLGKVRYLGNLDLARNWERAIRRAGLPVAYSEGFSPRPKLHYGLALPTGAESHAEYLDIDLSTDIDIDDLPERLSVGMPVGISVTDVGVVPSNATALQAVVDHCTWEFEFVGPSVEALTEAAERLMALEEVPLTFERKKKAITEDIRPALLDVSVAPERRGDAAVVTAVLATKPRSIRPSEFLTVIAVDSDACRVSRIEQWMTVDGSSLPPHMAGSDAVASVNA